MKREIAAAMICMLAAVAVIVVDSRRGLSAEPSPRPPAAQTRSVIDNVVLVTLDGVRYQEIFDGVDPILAKAAHLPVAPYQGPAALLPNIHALFFDGGAVIGDPRLEGGIAASGPLYVSLPGYVELLTGEAGLCGSNECEPSLGATLVDEIAAHEGGDPSRVAVFASWERLARVAAVKKERAAVDAGRGVGEAEPPFPGYGAYRPDHFTARAAMDHLLQHRPRFLWVALGDTDEWAHRGDYRGYIEALRADDDFIGQIAAQLATMGEYGARTALVVTADHGRGQNFHEHGAPDSAAVWLLARASSLPQKGRVATARRRHLRDVAPTLRALLGLAPRACEACGAPIDELLPRQVQATTARATALEGAATRLF